MPAISDNSRRMRVNSAPSWGTSPVLRTRVPQSADGDRDGGDGIEWIEGHGKARCFEITQVPHRRHDAAEPDERHVGKGRVDGGDLFGLEEIQHQQGVDSRRRVRAAAFDHLVKRRGSAERVGARDHQEIGIAPGLDRHRQLGLHFLPRRQATFAPVIAWPLGVGLVVDMQGPRRRGRSGSARTERWTWGAAPKPAPASTISGRSVVRTIFAA